MSGSLFEGMVLFSPSDLLPSSSPSQKEPSAPTPSHHHFPPPSPPSPTPLPTSSPLDEDFFSHLSPPIPPTISRKKKRSSRIGYAREAIDPPEIPSSPKSAKDVVDTLEIMEEKLNLVRSTIATKYEGVRKAATLAYSERKELGRRRRKAEQDVNKASLMYRELEQQLEVACEAEDFERAEKVSERLAAAEEEKDRLLNALRETETGCDCFDLRMQEVFNLQIAAEEEGVECLEKFAEV